MFDVEKLRSMEKFLPGDCIHLNFDCFLSIVSSGFLVDMDVLRESMRIYVEKKLKRLFKQDSNYVIKITCK